MSIYALQANGAITGSGTVTLGSGGLILNSASTSTANFTFGTSGTSEAVITASANATISGAITANNLTKGGIGTLVLSGANSGLTGNIQIDQGILQVSADSALGSGTVVINGGEFYSNGTTTKNIQVGPLGGYLQGGAIQGVISNSSAGSGPLSVLYQTSLQNENTWTGGLYVYQTMRLDSTATTFGTVGNGPVIVVAGGSIHDYGQAIETGWNCAGRLSLLGTSGQTQFEIEGAPAANSTFAFGSIEGTGDFVFGGYQTPATPILSIGSDNTSTNYYGKIYDEAGTAGAFASFIKTGTGTLTLWGNNAWHGTTTINGGALVINGGLYTGDETGGLVTVASSGTLGGFGTVQRSVTVAAGGTLAGSLEITGTLTTVAGDSLNLTAGSTTPTAVGAFAAGGLAGSLTVTPAAGFGLGTMKLAVPVSGTWASARR